MTILSAGILVYRETDRGIDVLLVHPGGPFWSHRDRGAWSIPKGELNPGESAEAAARREFREELGAEPHGALLSLGRVRQRPGKDVEAFVMEGNFDVSTTRSNLIEITWPPGSTCTRLIPEIDRAEWFALPIAHQKIVLGQRAFLDRLEFGTARRRLLQRHMS